MKPKPLTRIITFMAIVLLVLLLLATDFGSNLLTKAFGFNGADVRRAATNGIYIATGLILVLAGVSAISIPILAFALAVSGLLIAWKGVGNFMAAKPTTIQQRG